MNRLWFSNFLDLNTNHLHVLIYLHFPEVRIPKTRNLQSCVQNTAEISHTWAIATSDIKEKYAGKYDYSIHVRHGATREFTVQEIETWIHLWDWWEREGFNADPDWQNEGGSRQNGGKLAFMPGRDFIIRLFLPKYCWLLNKMFLLIGSL